MAKDIKNYQHFIPSVKLREDMPGANEHVLVTSIEQLQEIFAEDHDFMSLDFETSGLSPEVDFIVGYSFAFSANKGYYVPVKHAQGISLGAETMDMLYERVMRAKRVFLYNARFDMRFFEFAGYDLSTMKYFDVMNGIWFADSNVKMPGLKWACFTGDTKIQTRNGSKRIDSVNEGDEVVYQGGYYQILSKNCSYKETVEVEFEDGSLVRCTPDHKFLCRDGNGFKWVCAEDLDGEDVVSNQEVLSSEELIKISKIT